MGEAGGDGDCNDFGGGVSLAHDERRDHLIRLMGQYRLSCPDIARIMDRKPVTVRRWRSGHCPMTDHAIALLELILHTQMRMGA